MSAFQPWLAMSPSTDDALASSKVSASFNAGDLHAKGSRETQHESFKCDGRRIQPMTSYEEAPISMFDL
jgi:hypothetical protein